MNITMRLFLIPCVFFIIPGLNPTINALQPPSAVDTGLLVEQMKSALHESPRRVTEREAEDVIIQLIENILATGRKPVISIDGKTGVGKSIIADLVLRGLKKFKIIHVDDYGISMGGKHGARSVNWDSLIKEVGRWVDDDNTNGVIVEGLGVLYAQRRGQKFDFNIHITADIDTQIINLTSKGLSVEDARQQIIEFEQYQNYRDFDPVYDVIVDTSIELIGDLPDLIGTRTPKVSRAVTSSH